MIHQGAVWFVWPVKFGRRLEKKKERNRTAAPLFEQNGGNPLPANGRGLLQENKVWVVGRIDELGLVFTL